VLEVRDPDGAEADYLDELREMMRDHHGWQVLMVEHDRRPFAYTVGLHNRGLPELLITGLNAHVSNRVLKSIGHMIVADGTYLAPAMHIDYQDRFLMEVVEVDHPDVHLKYAVRICGQEVRALQLVWADDRGRWPWEAGWGNGQCSQPVFGVRTPLLG
jgi:hypothetical protein